MAAGDAGSSGAVHPRNLPEGVCWLTDVSESTAQWCVYGKVDTHRDFLLFYRGESKPSMIPLRAFSSTEEAERFVSAAKELVRGGNTDALPLA